MSYKIPIENQPGILLHPIGNLASCTDCYKQHQTETNRSLSAYPCLLPEMSLPFDAQSRSLSVPVPLNAKFYNEQAFAFNDLSGKGSQTHHKLNVPLLSVIPLNQSIDDMPTFRNAYFIDAKTSSLFTNNELESTLATVQAESVDDGEIASSSDEKGEIQTGWYQRATLVIIFSLLFLTGAVFGVLGGYGLVFHPPFLDSFLSFALMLWGGLFVMASIILAHLYKNILVQKPCTTDFSNGTSRTLNSSSSLSVQSNGNVMRDKERSKSCFLPTFSNNGNVKNDLRIHDDLPKTSSVSASLSPTFSAPIVSVLV